MSNRTQHNSIDTLASSRVVVDDDFFGLYPLNVNGQYFFKKTKCYHSSYIALLFVTEFVASILFFIFFLDSFSFQIAKHDDDEYPGTDHVDSTGANIRQKKIAVSGHPSALNVASKKTIHTSRSPLLSSDDDVSSGAFIRSHLYLRRTRTLLRRQPYRVMRLHLTWHPRQQSIPIDLLCCPLMMTSQLVAFMLTHP